MVIFHSYVSLPQRVNHHWLVVYARYTSLTNMTSSVGMMKFPTGWKIIKFHGSNFNPPTRSSFTKLNWGKIRPGDLGSCPFPAFPAPSPQGDLRTIRRRIFVGRPEVMRWYCPHDLFIQCGASQWCERWFINPMNTLIISIINHSYWSYVHQFSFRKRGHHIVSILMLFLLICQTCFLIHLLCTIFPSHDWLVDNR